MREIAYRGREIDNVTANIRLGIHAIATNPGKNNPIIVPPLRATKVPATIKPNDYFSGHPL